MHKSSLNYSLFFLIGSLIMLVPFTTINFSNVNAQEYGSYDDDNYYDNSYSEYPTDDKKYECRTGPAEGFFVSSVEFCKHIKFDDKNRKDNRDDSNRTGIQGPPGPPGLQGPAGPAGPQGERGLTGATGAPGQSIIGPQGAPGINGINGVNGTQGPPGANGTNGLQGLPGLNGINGTDGVNGTQGPQGPPGITFINNSNTYVRTADSVHAPALFASTAEAFCDIGDFLIHGGFRVSGFPTNVATLYHDELLGANGESGWQVTLNAPTTFQNFILSIRCFDNPPAHIP